MIILVDYFEGEHKEGKEWDGKKYKYNEDGQLIKEFKMIDSICKSL